MPDKESIDLSITNFYGTSYRVSSCERDLHHLEYRATNNSEHKIKAQEHLSISDAALQQFFASCIELHFTEWKERYSTDAIICNGNGWLFRISTSQLDHISFGNNAYPENFDAFLEAVRNLLGGRDFA